MIPTQVPALRGRREDIPLLARHFLERFRKTMEKPADGISPEVMSKLEAYDWPGNVRELENAMERSVALEPARRFQHESGPTGSWVMQNLRAARVTAWPSGRGRGF